MLSRRNSDHDSSYSASDTSTIEYDSQQGVGRVLFSIMRLAGNTVERRFLPNDMQTSRPTSTLTPVSTFEWDDVSETSTISRDNEQGVGRIAWHFMRFAGEKVELFANRNHDELLLLRKELEKEARARSVEIDRQLSRDRKSVWNEPKLLILGCTGAGKSTVIKQMKLQYGGSYTPIERESFKLAIRSHSIHSLKDVITVLRRLGLELSLDCNKHANTIMRVDTPKNVQHVADNDDASSEVSTAISFVCKDTAIMLAISRLQKSYFEDFVLYFFRAADRVFDAGYIPTDEDILYCREKNTSVAETAVSCNRQIFKLYDAPSDFGAHSLCSKWVSHFNVVTAPIFVVALSDYDQMVEGDPFVNRMDETFNLFKAIFTSQWFIGTNGIILLFNKMDIFREKLPHSPLKAHFPDYTGGSEVNEAIDYFVKRFRSLTTHEIYLHYTTLTEANQDLRIIPAAVQDMELRRNIDSIKSAFKLH
ncbi:G-protein alpha subunit-domain-containing protein [Flagelloscypha sp. PMI_526]|nr:G-protein alpha subunit-domain-containing protein [Flagelloscypha sp. PMI_526]